MTLQTYELIPIYNRQKSYYCKAKVEIMDNGVALRSYDTIVCYIDNNGEFHRTWDAWSVTTAKHVDEFCKQHDMSAMCKKEWEVLPVETLG